MTYVPIQELAKNRWKAILRGVGIKEDYLSKKHGPCPICSGKDRFRFDDKDGKGTFYCNQCGAGSGVDLVMKFRKVSFIEAKRLIEAQIPGAAVVAPKAGRGIDPAAYVNMWRAARPLNGMCPASKFLISRGLSFDVYPSQLRFMAGMTYTHDDKSKTKHPAMLALFVAPDMSASTVHITYLDDYGRKAAVPKPRKLAPCPIPAGGAVRLSTSADHMGIAEGIETALAAHKLFGLPVWSALSANGLMKWQPPKTARRISIFGDTDASYAGQHKAYALACRLKTEGYDVDVCFPELKDTDWNDELLAAIKDGMTEAAE